MPFPAEKKTRQNSSDRKAWVNLNRKRYVGVWHTNVSSAALLVYQRDEKKKEKKPIWNLAFCCSDSCCCLLTRTSYWSVLRQKFEVKIRKIRISTFLQFHRTATRGAEEALTLRFRSFMYSVALLPLLRWTTTFMSAAIDRSDTRARSPSLPFFSLYLPPLVSSSLCSQWVGGRDVRAISLFLVTL